MPDFAYGGTITFDPNLTLQEKNKRIDNFPMAISNLLHYSKSQDTRYYLTVSKEYHKVDGMDDMEAPHLHFILLSQVLIPKYRIRAINNMFRQSYGRSQFYLMTKLKHLSYVKYIYKDVEKNDMQFGGHHYYEMNLEQPFEDIEDDFIDYDDYDDY